MTRAVSGMAQSQNRLPRRASLRSGRMVGQARDRQLLAAQEVPDLSQERRQATRRGHGLWDDLHQLQIGMVEGWVSEGTLRRLAGLVDRLRPALTDPDLDAAPDEIELRAAVELAKLTHGPA